MKMKNLSLLALALCVFAVPVCAQNVWTAKIDTFGNYVRSNVNPNANGVVSVFTPATNITVNRIQLVAAGGQVCTNPPAIRVTNGTTGYSLVIPNTKGSSGTVGPSSNDSGPISLSFTANQPISIKAVEPTFTCNPYEINIVVQYSVP
jgi:hypothetical protein